MPDEPLNIARFDHVNASGDLVFEALNRHFTVKVTDALERGILEAKQVKAEREGMPQPQASAALPISQIQSMIRAGMTAPQIAQQFAISEALVRRFAAPVETEKKYAIDQFLSMPTSKNPKNPRPNVEVIAESLRTSRIAMDSLVWKATRKHHEPWRIEASFDSAGRTIRADWSWNMRDNTVVPLNTTAKRLLGESTAPIAGMADAEPLPANQAIRDLAARAGQRPMSFDWTNAPAASAGSAAAAAGTPAGAAAGQTGQADASAIGGAQGASAAAAGQPSAAPESGAAGAPERSPLTAWLYGTKDQQHGTAAAGSAAGASAEGPSPSDAESTAQLAAVAPSAQPPVPGAPQTDQAAAGSAGAAAPGAQASGADAAAQQAQQPQPAAKKKSGRSAVPSWDEILFGE